MIPALLLACQIMTTVPEFKARLHEVCAYPGADRYIKGLDVTGDRERLRVTMTMTQSLAGQDMAGTERARWIRNRSRELWKIVRNFYFPLKRFEYVLRDGEGTPFCGFAWIEDRSNPHELPTSAECLTVVGPADPTEWWQR